MDKPKVIILVGPTAAGKSALAIELARSFDGEIVSADSMQVYKHMDIGTAKPTRAERAEIRHHMIDVAVPDTEYTAARYRTEASEVVREIASRGRAVIVAGGTGLYIKTLTSGIFDGPGADWGLRKTLLEEAQTDGVEKLHNRLAQIDAESAAAIHPNNVRRVIRALEVHELAGRSLSDFHREHAFAEEPFDTLKIGIHSDRLCLRAAIEARVDLMIERGLVDETRTLLDMGYSRDLKPMCALGYKETSAYLSKESTLDEAVEKIKKNTSRYAKRQMTWFKKDAAINWFDREERLRLIERVEGYLN